MSVRLEVVPVHLREVFFTQSVHSYEGLNWTADFFTLPYDGSPTFTYKANSPLWGESEKLR